MEALPNYLARYARQASHESDPDGHKSGDATATAAMNFSTNDRRRSLAIRTDVANRLNSSSAGSSLLTPPYSPAARSDGVESSHEQCQPTQSPPTFHTFLRAVYGFGGLSGEYDYEDDDSLTTAHIRPGDLILVHSVHENGWADGTVLSTGQRGWLPTNYCEAYDHRNLRGLLQALAHFWDLLGGSAGGEANLYAFERQDYVRGIIAGVRYLLEHTDCLHRESALVQRFANIRRARKGLLSDLSTLVSIAKRLQETLKGPYVGDVVHGLLDDLIGKAFKVVIRGASFMDKWLEQAANARLQKKASERSLTSSASTPKQKAQDDAHQSVHKLPPLPSGVEESETSSPVSTAGKSTPKHEHSTRVSHRLSSIPATGRDPSDLASSQLALAHDVCISHIGSFIGLHLHSKASADLLDTTNRLTAACNKLLTIVDQVHGSDPQASPELRKSRAEFQNRLDKLVHSTREAFQSADVDEGDDGREVLLMMPKQNQQLVAVGTSLIRAVGDCVAKTRARIERFGDFDLQEPQVGRADLQGHAVLGAVDDVDYGQPNRQRLSQAYLDEKALPMPPAIQAEQDEGLDASVAHFALSLADSYPRESSMTSWHGHNSHRSEHDAVAGSVNSSRKDSVDVSLSDTTGSQSTRNSNTTTISTASTRATTPEQRYSVHARDTSVENTVDFLKIRPDLKHSFDSYSSVLSTGSDTEAALLQRTFADELAFNASGQITAGSLPALVERLTLAESTPDLNYFAAFMMTFRLFTSPCDFAWTLMDRFEHIEECGEQVATPVRLRIYNVFKHWLENAWDALADAEALEVIRDFARGPLYAILPSASDRLQELVRKAGNGSSTGSIRPRMLPNGLFGLSRRSDGGVAPEPIFTKNQIALLRAGSSAGGAGPSILEFDAVEVARQLTLLAFDLFQRLTPQELLSLDWSNKCVDTCRARSVRALCAFNTDLAHMVTDSVLYYEDVKRRAAVIKRWTKIAATCAELNNFECVMAITCALDSSCVQRLKKTWTAVSKKSKLRLEELKSIVNFSRNHAALRQKLDNLAAMPSTASKPVVPFVGIFLTDLTFVDVGNASRVRDASLTSPVTPSHERGSQQLTPPSSATPSDLINFAKYARMARIVEMGILRFQRESYALHVVPELSRWLSEWMSRVRGLGEQDLVAAERRDGAHGTAASRVASALGPVGQEEAVVRKLYARSLALEPKDPG